METEIIKINPKEIKLLKLNARYMDNDEYAQLVKNIKRDGKLTSVPFCFVNSDGHVEVLSGNHRVMASIEAGLKEIEVMLCKENLSKEQRLAIQLSHNSITGKDDKEILKQLFDEIENIDLKEYAGLIDEFNDFCKTTEQNFSIPLLNYQALTLLFLPNEINEIDETLKSIGQTIEKNVILSNINNYDLYLKTNTLVSKCLNISNPSTTFLALLHIVNNHLDELKYMNFKKEEINTIPIEAIIEKSNILKENAIIIDKALNKMVNSSIIKKAEKDKGLRILCEKYLNNQFYN